MLFPTRLGAHALKKLMILCCGFFFSGAWWHIMAPVCHLNFISKTHFLENILGLVKFRLVILPFTGFIPFITYCNKLYLYVYDIQRILFQVWEWNYTRIVSLHRAQNSNLYCLSIGEFHPINRSQQLPCTTPDKITPLNPYPYGMVFYFGLCGGKFDSVASEKQRRGGSYQTWRDSLGAPPKSKITKFMEEVRWTSRYIWIAVFFKQKPSKPSKSAGCM